MIIETTTLSMSHPVGNMTGVQMGGSMEMVLEWHTLLSFAHTHTAPVGSYAISVMLIPQEQFRSRSHSSKNVLFEF